MGEFGVRPSRRALGGAILALAAACAAAPPPQTGDAGGPAVPAPALYQSSGHPELDAWRLAFHNRAVAEGRDPDVVKSVLGGVRPLDLYLGPDVETSGTALSDQAEFAKPVWEYLRTAVSDTRKQNGRSNLAGDAALFQSIEARYGVDAEVIAAIWGMETNYGGYIGDFDGPEVLANMAAEGRRRAFAENELLTLMTILERGHARRGELKAGWAGAMGQTQFMPSTYLAYAEDFDGDGKRDVWASRSDALASAANYLAASGYRPDQPWGVEVLAPTGFDFSLADGRSRGLDAWRAAGLSPLRGGSFETNGAVYAELWLPAGATGPKYLLFENFQVFKTYNRSDSYAFAVGLLADAIAGRPGPATPWPTGIEPLSVAEVKTLQQRLNTLGYDAGTVDGVAGRGTRAALQRFQKSRGLLADGYPTRQALAAVMAG